MDLPERAIDIRKEFGKLLTIVENQFEAERKEAREVLERERGVVRDLKEQNRFLEQLLALSTQTQTTQLSVASVAVSTQTTKDDEDEPPKKIAKHANDDDDDMDGLSKGGTKAKEDMKLSYRFFGLEEKEEIKSAAVPRRMLELHMKETNMDAEMKKDAIKCAVRASEQYKLYKDIGQCIKNEFSEKYGSDGWVCRVGGALFKGDVCTSDEHYIKFGLGELKVILFKPNK